MEHDFLSEDINGTNLYRILSEVNVQKKGNSMDYIEKSLERDLILIQAIQTGNQELLDKAAKYVEPETHHSYYYANPIIQEDPLRTRKNGMVIRNTLCRIGAALGGVPAIYLHLISEKYAIQIEQAQSPEYLEYIVSPNMFAEFCELVVNFSTAHYSNLIKEIVSYIGNHISEEVNVTILADAFHINNSHLARKFKKETGYTVSEYVNQQKIEAAKLLLQGKEMSVGEVAERLGYNSSSYFSKVFKKLTGESPIDYTNSNMHI